MFVNKITIGLTGLAILFLFSYIFFASTMSSLGYELSDKRLELSQTQQLLDELVVEVARRQSPDYITLQSTKQDMVEVNVVSRYIDTRDTALTRVNP